MNILNNKVKGVTLIELVVVIGIIGIFLLIVFPNSLIGIKQKTKDKAAITSMSQLVIEAEKVYVREENYDKVKCTTGGDPVIIQICTAVNNKLGTDALIIVPSSEISGAKNYCAYAKLLTKKSGADSYYCVDSTGNSIETTGLNQCQTNGQITCP